MATSGKAYPSTEQQVHKPTKHISNFKVNLYFLYKKGLETCHQQFLKQRLGKAVQTIDVEKTWSNRQRDNDHNVHSYAKTSMSFTFIAGTGSELPKVHRR